MKCWSLPEKDLNGNRHLTKNINCKKVVFNGSISNILT